MIAMQDWQTPAQVWRAAFSSWQCRLSVNPLPKAHSPPLYAATASDIHPGDYIGPAGIGETRGAPKRAYMAPVARDQAVAERLWQVSCELTGASWRKA